MSNAKQHAEWLSLVEVSGPFLTLSVLIQSYQFGLDAHESDVYRSVKEAYQEWEDSNAPHIHTAWIRFLLMNVLGYPAEFIGEAQSIPESAVANLEIQGERIRPDLAILDPEDPRKVKLPILSYPRNQKLDAPAAGSSWSASPHSRMQLLLQNTGLQAGFVTNGAQWSLVHVRKGEPTGFATWQTILLTEEKLLLQAFKGMLGVEATLGAPDGKSLFDLLDKSAQNQEEVTKELGRQVRQAVEVFINAVDRLDQDSGRKLLAGLEPKEVYNGALTVMMRLIFLLCAEERGLMDDRELYVQNYSVGALNDQLREIASGDEQVLEHRHDAWKRLLATFRLVHGGCNHENLNLPAYGGSLFDPTKYPYLEQCQIDNRVSLHLLDALEFLEIRVHGGGRERRRLSFRAIGVEQIGHVYEGLLDHTALRATEPVVGLTGKETEEEEIALSLLVAHKHELGKFFEKQKIKVSGNAEKFLNQVPEMLAISKLRVACDTDDALFEGVLPFLNIVREDSLEHIQVYPVGSLYVTAGADRRSSGTHYTPVSLTEELVRYALEPQVYVGPAEGLPRAEWKLKSAKDIIELKVCDMAMGSGAFLVQACRYLSERLVEAWQENIALVSRPIGFTTFGNYFTHPMPDDHHLKKLGSFVTTPIGELVIAEPSRELIAENPEERLVQARRIIADRCLYGVDINPMAVEMAKLSLWLTTMRRDRPFTFLDHALRVGDSLLGVREDQLKAMTMKPAEETGSLMFHWVPTRLEEVRELRKQVARIPSHDPDSVRRKAQINLGVRLKGRWLEEAADILLLAELRRFAKEPLARDEWDRWMSILKEGPYKLPEEVAELKAARSLLGRSTFNWELSFPDIFEAGGFDAVVGNPPFLGGWKITGATNTEYRDFLVYYIANGMKGSADLCAYFFLKAFSLLRDSGTVGMLATNTISQGDTRAVGLDQIVEKFGVIFRAEKSAKWPGDANLEVAKVWLVKGAWHGERVLGEQPVNQISAFLDDGVASGKPYRLKANDGLSYEGTKTTGMGYVLECQHAAELIEADSRTSEVLFPFLSGDDINTRPNQSPSRWVISFFDWPLGRIGQQLPISGESVLGSITSSAGSRSIQQLPTSSSRWLSANETLKKQWLQAGVVPGDYPGPVAADYPSCLEIIEQYVKPERQRPSEKGPDLKGRNYQLRYPLAERWWQHGEKRPELYQTINGLERYLVHAFTCKHNNMAFYSGKIIVAHTTVILATTSWSDYAVFQSSLHWEWALLYGNKLETRPQYSNLDCCDPFPMLQFSDRLGDLGERYYNHRNHLCVSLNVGLTALYNSLGDRSVVNAGIQEFRKLQASLDDAVRDGYGWKDLSLDHGFYGEGRDRRWTISPIARQEVLRRLLKLNHERYATEVAAGLHDKGKKEKPFQKGLTKSNFDALAGPRRNLFDDQLLLGEH